MLLSSKRRLLRRGYQKLLLHCLHRIDLEEAEDNKAELKEINNELKIKNERANMEVREIKMEIDNIKSRVVLKQIKRIKQTSLAAYYKVWKQNVTKIKNL